MVLSGVRSTVLVLQRRGLPFDFEPGQGWRYSNTGYYMLGMLLENVQGKPYAELIDELAKELGLANTRYDSNRELISWRTVHLNAATDLP
ncbi:MAG: D-alanyl-D-alanine carboxypeptidase [Neolewinella sp.]